jgi:predicted SnoaL-like aldol condensation-catalyzing enzyme
MRNETAKELVIRFIHEVWSEEDVDAADRYIAPKYTIHHDPGDPWDGKKLDLEGFKERVRLSRAPFPDQRFLLKDVFADGNAVVVTWSWTGTHRGDLPGFPASGRPITMSGITVYYSTGIDSAATGRSRIAWACISSYGKRSPRGLRPDDHFIPLQALTKGDWLRVFEVPVRLLLEPLTIRP